MYSQLPLGTLMCTFWRGAMWRMIFAMLSGTVWYLSGNEIPSGRGQENHVPDCRSHSAGKVYPSSRGVLVITLSFGFDGMVTQRPAFGVTEAAVLHNSRKMAMARPTARHGPKEQTQRVHPR